MKTLAIRAAAAALFALTLTGCIESTAPILADAEPVFGKHLRLAVYSLRKGFAHEPGEVTFNWNGALYARASGALRDIAAFSAHPFESGDYIIQAVPSRRTAMTEYALLHRLAEGVYQVIPIDENDADDPTRAAYCKTANGSRCRIETRAQLFAFARATAARQKDDGGLVLRLPGTPERPAHRKRR